MAAGLVSLPAIINAEETPSSVLTTLSSTTLSGYVDTSAQWNFGTGNAHLPDYKFGGSSKADGFNLDVIQLRIEKPLDEADWAAGYQKHPNQLPAADLTMGAALLALAMALGWQGIARADGTVNNCRSRGRRSARCGGAVAVRFTARDCQNRHDSEGRRLDPSIWSTGHGIWKT